MTLSLSGYHACWCHRFGSARRAINAVYILYSSGIFVSGVVVVHLLGPSRCLGMRSAPDVMQCPEMLQWLPPERHLDFAEVYTTRRRIYRQVVALVDWYD